MRTSCLLLVLLSMSLSPAFGGEDDWFKDDEYDAKQSHELKRWQDAKHKRRFNADQQEEEIVQPNLNQIETSSDLLNYEGMTITHKELNSLISRFKINRIFMDITYLVDDDGQETAIIETELGDVTVNLLPEPPPPNNEKKKKKKCYIPHLDQNFQFDRPHPGRDFALHGTHSSRF